MPFVSSIQVGRVEELVIPTKSLSGQERVVSSAIHKVPVSGSVNATSTGFDGDQQADLRVHGGIDKAVLVYSSDHFPFWSARVGREIVAGSFGENLTVSGIDETTVCIGDQFLIGTALMEISQPRQPCFKLSAFWKENQMIKWVRETGFTGWYARVIEPGRLVAGDVLQLRARPNPMWTIARANQMMFGQTVDAVAMAELYLLPELATAWKKDLG